MEGQPVIKAQPSQWFHCRLEPADTSARNDQGHWVRKATTWVVCLKHDIDRKPVVVLATDYIQIVSADVDTGEDSIWQIDGDVVPMRRRKGIIGFEFKVNQVRESPTWIQEMLIS